APGLWPALRLLPCSPRTAAHRPHSSPRMTRPCRPQFGRIGDGRDPACHRDHPPWRASEPQPRAAARSADRDKTRHSKRPASEWGYGVAPVRTVSTLQVLRRSVGYSWIVLPRGRPLALMHLVGRLLSSLAESEAMLRRPLVGMSEFGTERTCRGKLAMSAFGGKADMGYL